MFSNTTNKTDLLWFDSTLACIHTLHMQHNNGLHSILALPFQYDCKFKAHLCWIKCTFNEIPCINQTKCAFYWLHIFIDLSPFIIMIELNSTKKSTSIKKNSLSDWGKNAFVNNKEPLFIITDVLKPISGTHKRYCGDMHLETCLVLCRFFVRF